MDMLMNIYSPENSRNLLSGWEILAFEEGLHLASRLLILARKPKKNAHLFFDNKLEHVVS